MFRYTIPPPSCCVGVKRYNVHTWWPKKSAVFSHLLQIKRFHSNPFNGFSVYIHQSVHFWEIVLSHIEYQHNTIASMSWVGCKIEPLKNNRDRWMFIEAALITNFVTSINIYLKLQKQQRQTFSIHSLTNSRYLLHQFDHL